MSEHKQSDILAAMKQILAAEKESINSIPEALFVQRFLPLLTSTEQDVNLKPWTDIAGSPLLPVHIVDEKGNVLFDVPPLMRNQITNSSRTEHRSMAGLSALATAKSRLLPEVGRSVFINNYESFIPSLDPEKVENDQWQAILERYGLSETVTAVEDPTPSQQKVNFSDDQDELL